jgi:hypothetical protein
MESEEVRIFLLCMYIMGNYPVKIRFPLYVCFKTLCPLALALGRTCHGLSCGEYEWKRVMNLTLLYPLRGQWVYHAQDQAELARFSWEVLQWDLYAFDCWVFDDSNWSMYTRQRQRLIALRSDLSIAHAQVSGDRIALQRLLSAHCISVCKATRSGRLPENAMLKALECACRHAKRQFKALGPAPTPMPARPRREDELTAQRLLLQLSGHSAQTGR